VIVAAQGLYVVGYGAVTSLGATTRVAMAAARGGLTRMMLDDPDADEEEGQGTNIAPVSTLATEEPPARGLAMLRRVAAEALRPIERRSSLALGVWVGGPAALAPGPMIKEVLARTGAFGATTVTDVGGHGSAPLWVLPQVIRALGRGEVDLALLAAFDLRTDPDSLAAGRAAERTIGPGRHWGHVPGDAAAAVVLCSPRGLERSGLTAQLTLAAAGTGHEPAPPGGPVPCLGTGLTEAITAALAGSPKNATVDAVVTDINGERGRSDEWGFTVPRIVEHLKDPDALSIPSLAWGDCGAVNGLLALGLASSIVRDLGRPDAQILIWTAGEGHERAAALVQPAPSSRSGAPSAARADDDADLPDWAAALDREIIAELAEECAFRYQQRADLMDALGDGELPKSWTAIARAEDQLDVLTAGMGEIGSRAAAVTAEGVDPGEPGTLYAAVRTRLESGDVDQAAALAATFVRGGPALAEAALNAFKHARNPAAAPSRAVPALLAGAPELAGVALELAATTGTGFAHHLRDNQATAEAHPLPFIRAVGRTMALGAARQLDRFISAPDPGLRQEAVISSLLLGAPDLVNWLWGALATDRALLIPAALVADSDGARRICELAGGQATPDSVVALGVLGDPASVPLLLAALEGEHGAAAATALELLLGESPTEPGTKADEDPSAEDRPVSQRSLRWDAWDAVARAKLARHPPGARLRAGQPAVSSATARLLQAPHLGTDVRRWLALELAIRYGTRPVPDPTALIRVQRPTWAALAAVQLTQPAGSWDIARPRVRETTR
jgi:3-oxoacyl-[acyl-carrier-protein] synthase-1